jgi:zinc protease
MLSAAMLEAGSAGRSQAEIAAKADAMGASLDIGAGPDSLFVSLTALPIQFRDMAELLSDLVLRPNLDPREWDKVKARRLAQLQSQSADPAYAADVAFHATLYGSGAQGRPALGTPDSVAATRLKDVRTFLEGRAPEGCALVVVGAVAEATALPILEACFGKPWGGRTALRRPKPDPLPANRPRLATVDFPGKPQTILMIGQPGVPSASPDAPALALLNEVLGPSGGGFTTRLNLNLREEHGYCYEIYSDFAFGSQAGPFQVKGGVKTSATGASVAEVLKELSIIRKERIPEEELSKGKAMLAYQLVLTFQDAKATAMLLANNFCQGLPLNHVATLSARIQSLDAAQVQASAKRVLDPDTMTILLAGDTATTLPQLVKAGLSLPQAKAYTPYGAVAPTK